VIDPQKAIIQVEDYSVATSQLAQTTLRSVLGRHDLDEMLAERERMNADIQQILDQQTDAWGVNKCGDQARGPERDYGARHRATGGG
jgi:regulator of protease activity HflC (stomatin/prohibitin superfamily)